MRKSFLLWGFLFGFLGVVLGALGAHALKPLLNESQLSSFETGVRFQMYHALLLILIAQIPELARKNVLFLLIAGTFCFSFSIYLLSMQDVLLWGNLKFLGPVTPFGGLLLISAWVLLFFKSFKLISHK